ncbi:MAG: hypothetical protein V1706_06085 [Pseudomonadota bacterium]
MRIPKTQLIPVHIKDDSSKVYIWGTRGDVHKIISTCLGESTSPFQRYLLATFYGDTDSGLSEMEFFGQGCRRQAQSANRPVAKQISGLSEKSNNPFS